jgi:hypothetical protein
MNEPSRRNMIELEHDILPKNVRKLHLTILRRKRMRRNRCIEGAVVVLFAVGLLSIANFGPSRARSASASANDSIESTVTQFANAEYAVYSPLASATDQNSSCQKSSCTPTMAAATSADIAMTQFSDVSLPSIAQVNWRLPSIVGSRFNVSGVDTRNLVSMHAVAASSVSALDLKSATIFIADEYSILNGNDAGCNVTVSCTITSSAGATMLSFSDEVVNGSSATVDATFMAWQQMANVDSSGTLGPWYTAKNELSGHYILARSATGNWIVTSRVTNFLPGQGP